LNSIRSSAKQNAKQFLEYSPSSLPAYKHLALFHSLVPPSPGTSSAIYLFFWSELGVRTALFAWGSCHLYNWHLRCMRIFLDSENPRCEFIWSIHTRIALRLLFSLIRFCVISSRLTPLKLSKGRMFMGGKCYMHHFYCNFISCSGFWCAVA